MIVRMNSAEVAIVGAGPVGALAALGLAQRGHDVVVFEAEPSIVRSPRAMVYYWHVLDGLDRLGVLGDMDAAGLRNTSFQQRVLSTGLRADIPLDPVAAISPYAYNVHLGQHEVVEIALQHLARYPNARILNGATVTAVRNDADHAVLDVDGPEGLETWTTRWVLGADGARSAVRHSLGLSFDGTTWPQRFVATNIQYPFDVVGGLAKANMIFDPEHGAVIAQINDTGLWRWTWSESAELPEDSVLDRLPGRLAALGFGDVPFDVDSFTPYRMHQRMVDTMRTGRVLLLGDAAHATNPTGGFGLTSGIYDLLALIEPLSAALRGTADESLLDHWAETRLSLFREFASPMASRIKGLVYDTSDTAALEGMVRAAGDFSDPAATLNRLTGMTVLRSDLPRHHEALA
ncbi:3-(3-hydroxy-phenyl)propionate hydroxylase/6-hydroxy-3-succinoylpyridine 3-monooxygenase [Agreia bicolorata]|uniref:3-(3-hydroxy-phenyl)propionate hydroxylase/6-hydroxy-3-succinoylpyridine 3-monooxygenase n=2 Tax=Agreia bicolorata TaxID=110935 RepID=A0A1T4XN39_9MICO|nr:3-(3-hydroxy-phenyl)propionate hydroxylase/6-hydroxy-3-succinoylpyridine 3-monooxygenase [Agreia bicolorata]